MAVIKKEMEVFIKTALYEGFKVKDSNLLEATNFRFHHEIFVNSKRTDCKWL